MELQPGISSEIGLVGRRNGRHPRFGAAVLSKLWGKAASAVAIAFLAAVPAGAQQPRGYQPPPPPRTDMQPNSDPLSIIAADSFASVDAISAPSVGLADVGRMMEAESCNTWTESGVHSPTVSAIRLGVPGKASSEYQKACGDFKGKKLANAETHLHKAIDLYPNYSAAYVVLGQVLQSEDKKDEAQTACSKAQDLDPGYVAPYLCLAELAANDGDWKKLAEQSGHALSLDPVGNPYSLYYAADAGLHFNQLSQAEMKAQAAIKLDTWHHLPELHLLLAQIYEAEANVQMEIAQLHEFLKQAPNFKDAPKARATLARLEMPPAK
jgi:hypothetical protein